MFDDPIHDSDILGETATRGFESGGATDFLVGRTLSESLILTVEALAARDVVEDHDTVAGAVSVDAFANGRYYTGGFVPEDAGGGVGAGGDLF
jgi:hypothetical protein